LWGRNVDEQMCLAVPFLNRLHDISVWRQFGTIWSKIVYRSLDLIEHKYRWPPMMMNRLFVVWLQGYLKHAKALVLEDDFVVLRSRHHRIQGWIPGRWIQIRTVIRHVTLASSVHRSEQYSSTRLEQCPLYPQKRTFGDTGCPAQKRITRPALPGN